MTSTSGELNALAIAIESSMPGSVSIMSRLGRTVGLAILLTFLQVKGRYCIMQGLLQNLETRQPRRASCKSQRATLKALQRSEENREATDLKKTS